MAKKYGPWTIHRTEAIHDDPWVSVRQDAVTRPDGKPGTYTTIRIKPGVTVLAIDADDTVCLTREFHYAVGRYTLEAVSGGIDEGETPEAAARRELEEELGIVAESLQPIGVVDPFTASVLSPTHLFIAERLQFVDSKPEGTEQIELVKMQLDEVVAKVHKGEITHAPSCVAILMLALKRAKTP